MRLLAIGGRLCLAGLGACVWLGASWPAQAQAAAWGVLPAGHGAGHHCYGNGAHNLNSFSIKSPTWIRGVQNASNTNVASQEFAQNAVCRKKRYCKIVQIDRAP